MLRHFNNQKGFAIVYGLIVLLLATVGGTGLLFMTRKARINASDYGKMRVVSQAALAALKACEGQFYDDPETALAILKKFTEDPDSKWLLGGADNADTEQRFTLGDHTGAPEYSARIVGFDEDNCILKVEGTGYGNSSGKKRVIALYRLGGLHMIMPPPPDINCLYLAGGLNNCDDPLTVNGNVFIGGSNMINSNGNLTVTGTLKTGTGSFNSNSLVTVNGTAFIRGPAQLQGSAASSTFNGDVGFKQDLALISMSINVHGNFYINGNDSGSGSVLINGGSYTAKYYTAGGFDPGKLITTAPATKEGVSSSIDLASALSTDDADETAPSIVTDLETFITSSGGTIYTPGSAGLDLNTPGWNLNNAYQTNSKWNDFLVVKTTSQMWMNANGGIFNGKVIWIIDCASGFEAKNWYGSGPLANTFIYLKNTGYLTNFGESMVGTPASFRGVIYNASTGSTIPSYKFQTGTTIDGAIIHTGSTGVQFNNTSGGVTINYDADIINEFINLGILIPPSGSDDSDDAVLTLTDTRIRPTAMGVQL